MKGLNKIPGQIAMTKTSVRSLKQVSLSLITGIILMLIAQKDIAQGIQSFPTTGTFPNGFTVPPGVTSITVQVWGGGGGGGTDAGAGNGGPGGGGGAYASSVLTVVPGAPYTIVVGAGGSGAVNNGAAATAGGPSSFGALVIALGGGFSTTSTGAQGGQASGSTGDFKSSGSNGGNGNTNTNSGGGGGGASGNSGNIVANGANGATGGTGGAGGDGPDGDGGRGGNSGANNDAQPGTAPGGGGGGRGDNGGNSDAGAIGRVVITWTCPSATISYSSSYCKSLTSATPVITGSTGGTFSATPAGLTINTSTGEINPSTSTTGTYTIHYQVAGGNGCPAVDATAPVTINATPVASATSTNINCFGAGDGTITVSASGSTGPYTFSVDGTNFFSETSTDTRLFTGLAPNTPYTIKVKDANGCESK